MPQIVYWLQPYFFIAVTVSFYQSTNVCVHDVYFMCNNISSMKISLSSKRVFNSSKKNPYIPFDLQDNRKDLNQMMPHPVSTPPMNNTIFGFFKFKLFSLKILVKHLHYLRAMFQKVALPVLCS
jgi:hypothetical protein